MSTPTVVPMMVWTAFLVWGYMCMAVVECCILACRYLHARGAKIAMQAIVGVLLLCATVWYNNIYNSGQVRWYILLGMVAGGAIYYLVCYDVVQNIVHKLVNITKDKPNK